MEIKPRSVCTHTDRSQKAPFLNGFTEADLRAAAASSHFVRTAPFQTRLSERPPPAHPSTFQVHGLPAQTTSGPRCADRMHPLCMGCAWIVHDLSICHAPLSPHRYIPVLPMRHTQHLAGLASKLTRDIVFTKLGRGTPLWCR